jgi:hypothetical protein
LTQYYYLVASLPMLVFGDAPPLDSHPWLDLCREQVAEGDHALLTRISFDTLDVRPGDHEAWQAYASWETALRNELARQRGQRLGRNPGPFMRDAPFYAGLSAIVKEALNAGTPMAVETALDHTRWSYLEELGTGTQFDLGRLIVYRLQLLLLERKDQFRPQPGLESFTKGYSRVLDNAAAWASAANSPLDTDTR